MHKAFAEKGGKMSRSVGAFQSVKLQLVRTIFAQKTFNDTFPFSNPVSVHKDLARNSPLLLTELSEF